MNFPLLILMAIYKVDSYFYSSVLQIRKPRLTKVKHKVFGFELRQFEPRVYSFKHNIALFHSGVSSNDDIVVAEAANLYITIGSKGL